MKVESTVKPNKYEIQSIKNGKSTILFFDNIEETERVSEETEETEIIYVYNMYKIKLSNREKLEEELEMNYDSWLAHAKQLEYDTLAAKIRAKRDKLLEETDAEMCLDRLNLEIPDGNTFTAWLSFLKTLGESITGDMAIYRQALRDITDQENFPYSVKFPEKP